MANKKTNKSSQSRQTKSTRKAPKVKNIIQKQKGPARDADGKFTAGSGGLTKFKDFNWKRILPVVIVVALVGGFLVYRSFAGNAALLATPGSNSGKQECTNAAGTVVKETSGSKRNASVCQLNVGKTIKPIVFGASDVTATANITEAQFMGNVASKTSTTGYYQVCYNIRNAGTSTTSVLVGSYASGSSPSGGTTISVANTDYASVCDPVSHKSGSTRPFLKVATGSVRIGSVTIATANAPQTPPPTTPVGCVSFPDSSCTGTKTDADKLPKSGSINTTKDGQVIQNLDISGEVRVYHNNVTIKNVRIKSQGGNAIYMLNNTGLVIEDCYLDGQGRNAEPAVAHHNYIMRRCEVVGYGEGPRVNGNVTLEDNYMHNFANFVAQGAHADGVQGIGGGNVTIRHNTILMEPDGANGAVFFSTSGGSGIKIENNLLGGGNFAVNLDHTLYSNVNILNNHFTTTIPYHEKGGYFGPIAPGRGSNWTVSGNVWHDGPNAGKPAN